MPKTHKKKCRAPLSLARVIDLQEMEKRMALKLSELNGRLTALADTCKTIADQVGALNPIDPNIPADAEQSLINAEAQALRAEDELNPQTPPPIAAGVRRSRV